eukprot:1319724-Pleurochrysis_carterae.AAC.5
MALARANACTPGLDRRFRYVSRVVSKVYAAPIGMLRLISYVDAYEGGAVSASAVGYGCMVAFGPLCSSIGDAQTFNNGWMMGTRMRAFLTHSVSAKALRYDPCCSSSVSARRCDVESERREGGSRARACFTLEWAGFVDRALEVSLDDDDSPLGLGHNLASWFACCFFAYLSRSMIPSLLLGSHARSLAPLRHPY